MLEAVYRHIGPVNMGLGGSLSCEVTENTLGGSFLADATATLKDHRLEAASSETILIRTT